MSRNSSISKSKRVRSQSSETTDPIAPHEPSDQVATPTSLELEDTIHFSSSKRKVSSQKKSNPATPSTKKTKIKEEDTAEKSAANMFEHVQTLETLPGIASYLQSKGMSSNKEVISGYKELESAKASAECNISKLKALGTFHQIDNFDWSKIEEAYTFIFNDYIFLMESIIKELDQSLKVSIIFFFLVLVILTIHRRDEHGRKSCLRLTVKEAPRGKY